MDDSPPGFLVVAPRLAPVVVDLYARSLDLAQRVNHVIEHVPGRYPLRHQLDVRTTEIAVALSRAAHEPHALRARHYRAAQKAASDVAALLDVLDVQLTTRDHRDTLDAARISVRVLLAELGPLARGAL